MDKGDYSIYTRNDPSTKAKTDDARDRKNCLGRADGILMHKGTGLPLQSMDSSAWEQKRGRAEGQTQAGGHMERGAWWQLSLITEKMVKKVS